MNTIKEFLKPNRWKVGIWVTISVFSIVTGALGWATEGRFLLPSTILWLFWVFAAIPGVMASAKFINNILVLIPYGLVYWYFLSCLIYFIFKKVRGLLLKKSGV